MGKDGLLVYPAFKYDVIILELNLPDNISEKKYAN